MSAPDVSHAASSTQSSTDEDKAIEDASVYAYQEYTRARREGGTFAVMEASAKLEQALDKVEQLRERQREQKLMATIDSLTQRVQALEHALAQQKS